MYMPKKEGKLGVSIQTALGNFIKKNFGENMWIEYILRTKWDEIVGNVSEKVEISSYKDGALTLFTRDSSTMLALSYGRAQLIDKVNSFLNEMFQISPITDIKVVGKKYSLYKITKNKKKYKYK